MIDRAHTDDDQDAPAVTAPLRRRTRRSSVIVGVVSGALLTLVSAVIIAVVLYRDPLPLLTAQSLAVAEQRWRDAGPKSYRLSVEILGRQPGVVELTVRDGEVTEMTRDGRAPEQRRTWAAWTVPSQFDMLHLELEHEKNSEQGYGAPRGSQAIVKAEFDPKYGYPRRVRRQVLGANLDMEWRVTRFTPLTDQPPN